MSEDPGDDPVPLREALESVLRSLGPVSASPGGRLGTVSVFRCWAEAVGPTVADHARPVALDDGRLLVEVDQPGWATQLRFLSATLLERLAEAVGPSVVHTIEVRVARR